MNYYKFVFLFLLFLLTISSCEDAVERTFQKGVNAYNEGNYTSAVDYFEEAANSGYGKANLALGVMYDEGIGVQQSDRRAFEYFYAANLNMDPMGTFRTGLCYLYGSGVPQNEMLGINFVVRAAELGLEEAKDFCDEHNITYDHLKAAQNSVK